MQCPYCAEEIKDAATICRHCGRDILRDKLSYLDKEMSNLKSYFKGLEAWSGYFLPLPLPEPKDKLPIWQQALAVMLAALAAFGALLLYYVLSTSFKVSNIVIPDVFPFFPGLWIGLKWQ